MNKIIDAWDFSKQGDFIATLDARIPNGLFKKCRVDENVYTLVPVHVFGTDPNELLKHVGIKANKDTKLIGKEIEFI